LQNLLLALAQENPRKNPVEPMMFGVVTRVGIKPVPELGIDSLLGLDHFGHGFPVLMHLPVRHRQNQLRCGAP
jgi:hypothetical protein